ncbi:MAG: hypothetical protein GY862_18155 [Gammaproteobacteria bacterium]|nr:hypothetical protein [Gammaproteobacteria bacterium]
MACGALRPGRANAPYPASSRDKTGPGPQTRPEIRDAWNESRQGRRLLRRGMSVRAAQSAGTKSTA